MINKGGLILLTAGAITASVVSTEVASFANKNQTSSLRPNKIAVSLPSGISLNHLLAPPVISAQPQKPIAPPVKNTITQQIIREIETIKEIEIIKEIKTIEKEKLVEKVIEQPINQTIQQTNTTVEQIVQKANLDDLGTIPYGKLNLADAITNADIAADAKIHYSKLDLAGLSLPAAIEDGDVTDAKLSNSYLQLGSGLNRGDKIYAGSFDFDNKYANGGELADLTSVFSSQIKAVIVTSAKGGYGFEVDETLFSARQFKIKAINLTNGNEANNNANLNSLTEIRFIAIGS